jgi:iron complex outermembrane recepter protein
MNTTNTPPLASVRGYLAIILLTLAWCTAGFAADPVRKVYDVPAGDAATTLRDFSQQSGEQIFYPTDAVRGVQTRAVSGELSARGALEQMLEGTDLVIVQDSATGALAVQTREAAVSRPSTVGSRDSQALKLEDYRVLGSRIRQTETEGPSPVSSYDADYIRSTGAFTLADFLNQIPQTYSGIASGRSSTPNELNPEFGQRTETSTPAFNFVTGSSAAPPGQTGVSGVSLRGLGSGSTLVLVDGRRATQSGAGNRSSDTRQGFVDLNTIPLGMIERIEVITDGASAIYGADAVAGVINIVLKKYYVGTEISGSFKTAEHGGGRERSLSVMQGFTYGKLSGSVSVEYYDRQNLKASERRFSKDQNHTGIPRAILLADGSTAFGRDYRLNWGYPAVIQASGGTVAGTFNAIPGVRVVLAPEGATQTPTLSQFIPVLTPVPGTTVVNASGQRRYNTAEFLDLIPETERMGASVRLSYRFNDRLEAYTSLRTSESKSLTNAQIAGNSITGAFGAPAVLLAAYSPFNQNVQIGMVLPEWGSATQRVRTLADSATFGLRGMASTWQWDLGGSWQNQKTRQFTRNFNGAPFANLLNNADPAQRFNPFIDYRAPGAPSQAALLETLSTYPFLGSEVTFRQVDFTTDGDLFDIWGGTVKMALGGSASRSEVESVAVNYSAAVVPVATRTVLAAESRGHAVFTEILLPVVGKPNPFPLVRRLDLQLAARYEDTGPSSKSVPKLGFSWAPVESLLFRGSWSEGFRAPGATEQLVANSTITSTLTDPRRTPPSTSGIQVTSGSNPNPMVERSENTFFGLVYEPKFLSGVTLQANYYDTTQRDVLQLLSAQVIVNNEALFPERITRAAPTSTDQSLNQPGQITAVSRVFVNFGEVVNRSADFNVQYQVPGEQFGRWRLNFAASRTLEATRALAPGQPPVILDDDTSSPPKWKFNTSLFWRHGNWNASAFLWYLDGFGSNNAGNALVASNATIRYFPTPSVTKLDLRVGYEFKDGVWRQYGKGLRVGVGVNNVFDKEPPFSDTVWGFNAGLHSQLILGRAYEFSFVLPF